MFCSLGVFAQTGIGTTTPDASAQLDVSSINKGFLPPRMTAVQRAGISTPAAGLLVYQTDGTAGYFYYTGAVWISLASNDASSIADGSVSNAEFQQINSVTSNVQTQIDEKQAAITGGATSITSSNLTVNRALVSDGSGKVAVSGTTSTELGYVSGVSSAIQTQLNAKAPLASPALTGNPTAPTQASTDNSTKIATTAYVTNAVTKGIGLLQLNANITSGTANNILTGTWGPVAGFANTITQSATNEPGFTLLAGKTYKLTASLYVYSINNGDYLFVQWTDASGNRITSGSAGAPVNYISFSSNMHEQGPASAVAFIKPASNMNVQLRVYNWTGSAMVVQASGIGRGTLLYCEEL